MSHFARVSIIKQLEKAARVPCTYTRGLSLIGGFLHGATCCSCPERLLGRLAHPIIGAEHCIIAPRSQKTRGLLEFIVAKLCIRVVKGT